MLDNATHVIVFRPTDKGLERLGEIDSSHDDIDVRVVEEYGFGSFIMEVWRKDVMMGTRAITVDAAKFKAKAKAKIK